MWIPVQRAFERDRCGAARMLDDAGWRGCDGDQRNGEVGHSHEQLLLRLFGLRAAGVSG